MAKTLAMSEGMNMPTHGKWIWKDESHTIEYISNNPGADKHDKRRDRRQQKAAHTHDQRGRISPTQMARGGPFGVSKGGGGKSGKGLGANRAQSVKQSSSENAQVTLDHIKSVAYEMESNKRMISEAFESLIDTQQFDEFLLCLLNYFHWYFEKKAHEEKPNPMNIEPSLREKKYYADLCTKIEKAQKVMGQSYCVLVLGIGMEGQHHMKAGISRVSNTYQDRDMYELLYSFCTFVVWIAFRRKDFDTAEKELNRILRSHTFNPAIRIKNAPDPKEKKPAEEKEEEKKKEKKLTPAEYRRQQGKRPPIKSIINQRSPALVSLLPSPKEEANWLFRRVGALSPTTLGQIGHEDLDAESVQKLEHLVIDPSKLHVGIVGEPLNQFHPVTLTPKGTENEGEEEEEDGEQKVKDGRRGSGNVKTPGSQERRHSRQATAVSQVTQEGLPDD